MADLVRAHGGRTRDRATGRIVRTPGRQFAAGGGTARIPLGNDRLIISDRPQVIVDAIERAASRVTAYLAVRTCERLIETTPVDTGFARASWIISIGSPTSLQGGTRESVSEAAQQVGLARMAAYHVRQGPAFVSNNAPYIMRLNAGHSTQAPIGFIQNAVDGAHADAEIAFGRGKL